MTQCKGITLGQLLDVCGGGTILHIGAENGNGWTFTGPAVNAAVDMKSWADREIVQLYQHEGREASRWCCKLDPGLAVVVEGRESGRY